ncbi:uncharacterized protein LOC117334080 [Pecten maximus]|uniref:uncharacterized protein LOC117334080 n=1 Tax=Pecten maximus TaxID=6579 RepID=UPI001458E89B|nr:uncharacterized protein LOC117334080 [Pecten maximus]
MLGKRRVLCVTLMGLVCCGLVGAQSRKRCDVRAGMKRRGKIPKVCEEGLITFDYPWMVDPKRSLVVNARGCKDGFRLCIYSCTEDVLIGDKQNLLKKNEIWCLRKGQKVTITKYSTQMSYSAVFRYFNKANLQEFIDRPKKSCWV